MVAKVKLEVHRRIQYPGQANNLASSEIDDDDQKVEIFGTSTNIALEAIKRRMKSGNLEAKDIEGALNAGDRKFVISALAVRANLPVDMVDRITESQDPKAVTALIWKGGLSMRLATVIQQRLAGIRMDAVLHPDNGRNFPLSEEDMNRLLADYTANKTVDRELRGFC